VGPAGRPRALAPPRCCALPHALAHVPPPPPPHHTHMRWLQAEEGKLILAGAAGDPVDGALFVFKNTPKEVRAAAGPGPAQAPPPAPRHEGRWARPAQLAACRLRLGCWPAPQPGSAALDGPPLPPPLTLPPAACRLPPAGDRAVCQGGPVRDQRPGAQLVRGVGAPAPHRGCQCSSAMVAQLGSSAGAAQQRLHGPRYGVSPTAYSPSCAVLCCAVVCCAVPQHCTESQRPLWLQVDQALHGGGGRSIACCAEQPVAPERSRSRRRRRRRTAQQYCSRHRRTL
jgi:hypothetical protein